jgi:hypothetical protein
MADIFVGNSEYDNLTGKPQYAEERAGLQLLALLAYIAPMLGGYRITINEARRSRADQDKFWNAYVRFLAGGPWAAVAAKPYRSKHDSGLAFDLGGPNGRVITDAAHALLVKYGPAYGIHWIGKNFGEKWHFEYVPGTASILASSAPAAGNITAPKKEKDMTDYALVQAKGDPRVFLSVNYVQRRWIRNQKDLADTRYLLAQAGSPISGQPVQVVDNIDAFGALVADTPAYEFVQKKGDATVYLSFGRMFIRAMKSPRDLADTRYTLRERGVLDADSPVRSVESLAGFGELI